MKVWCASFEVFNQGSGCEIFFTKAGAVEKVMLWLNGLPFGVLALHRKSLEREGYLHLSSSSYAVDEIGVQP